MGGHLTPQSMRGRVSPQKASMYAGHGLVAEFTNMAFGAGWVHGSGGGAVQPFCAPPPQPPQVMRSRGLDVGTSESTNWHAHSASMAPPATAPLCDCVNERGACTMDNRLMHPVESLSVGAVIAMISWPSPVYGQSSDGCRAVESRCTLLLSEWLPFERNALTNLVTCEHGWCVPTAQTRPCPNNAWWALFSRFLDL